MLEENYKEHRTRGHTIIFQNQIDWRWDKIDRGYNVVNVAFTIIEEGLKACSAQENHNIRIFKVPESDCDAMYNALQDIVNEARELTSITLNDRTYNIYNPKRRHEIFGFGLRNRFSHC